LKNEAHLQNCGTFGKMQHTRKMLPFWKSAAQLKKCATTVKNAPHLEKWGAVGKVWHT